TIGGWPTPFRACARSSRRGVVQPIPPGLPRSYRGAVAPTLLTEFDPRYGEPVAVSDGVVRVVADNPSKYTAWGTGTYVVGEAQVAVIDPGPDLPAHVDALLAALDGRAVSHILITHTHSDHSPAAAALAAAT